MGPADPTGAGPTGSSGPMEADGTGTTTGLGEIPPFCEPYVGRTVDCYGVDLELSESCSVLYAGAEYAQTAYPEGDCMALFEDYFACIAESSCEAWAQDCSEEGEAYTVACQAI